MKTYQVLVINAVARFQNFLRKNTAAFLLTAKDNPMNELLNAQDIMNVTNSSKLRKISFNPFPMTEEIAKAKCFECHSIFPKLKMDERTVQEKYIRSGRTIHGKRKVRVCKNCISEFERKNKSSFLSTIFKGLFRGKIGAFS
jgi:hypothetical protein